MKQLSKLVLLIILSLVTFQAKADKDRIVKRKINGGTFYLIDDKKDPKTINALIPNVEQPAVSAVDANSDRALCNFESYLEPIGLNLVSDKQLAPQTLVNIADATDATTASVIESQERAVLKSKIPDINADVKIKKKFNDDPKPGDPGKNWAAILSLVFAILSFFIMGIPFALVAIIFGAIGLKSQRKGLAIVGLIIGIVGLSLVGLALAIA